MKPTVHPASLKVGHGGTLDYSATGVLGTEIFRMVLQRNPKMLVFEYGLTIYWYPIGVGYPILLSFKNKTVSTIFSTYSHFLLKHPRFEALTDRILIVLSA
jgi:hypothetical protein